MGKLGGGETGQTWIKGDSEAHRCLGKSMSDRGTASAKALGWEQCVSGPPCFLVPCPIWHSLQACLLP